jgi:hypothetical protein
VVRGCDPGPACRWSGPHSQANRVRRYRPARNTKLTASASIPFSPLLDEAKTFWIIKGPKSSSYLEVLSGPWGTRPLQSHTKRYYGRAVAQAVSRWLPSAAAGVRFRAACGVFGGQSDTGVDFLWVFRFPLLIMLPPIIIITRCWHNRPISGRSAEWTQLDSTPPLYKFKNIDTIGVEISQYSDGLWAGRPGFESRQVKDFSHLQSVRTSYRTHPASYPMTIGGGFPGGKSAGAWRWPLTSI